MALEVHQQPPWEAVTVLLTAPGSLAETTARSRASLVGSGRVWGDPSHLG